MPDQRVPVKQTTPSMLEFARALCHAWRAVVSPELPTKEAAGVLWAHFAGETGDGRFCFNFNLGNWKHSPGSGLYMVLAGVWEGFKYGDEDKDGDVDEVDRALFVERMVRSGLWAVDPSADHAKAVGPGKVSLLATALNRTAQFRAYLSLESGMRSFIFHKKNETSRYFSAWEHVLAGDPERYARELGAKGYYTASPDVYAAAMKKKHAAWMTSDAFEEALAELTPRDEEKTPPRDEEKTPPRDEETETTVDATETTGEGDAPTVHAAVPLGRASLDGDLPDSPPPSTQPGAA